MCGSVVSERITELGRENAHSRKRAERAEALVELQKQMAALLGTPLTTEPSLSRRSHRSDRGWGASPSQVVGGAGAKGARADDDDVGSRVRGSHAPKSMRERGARVNRASLPAHDLQRFAQGGARDLHEAIE